MRLDPHTHAFVLCTALMTAITFAIFAMQLLGLVLDWPQG
jgi:hypothetical protein